MISIIIPIYNEEKILTENGEFFRQLAVHSELIFVDGGSADKSFDLAAAYGQVVKAPKGRAQQLNTGAACASKDILLFLHADTWIAPSALKHIEETILKKNYVGGCFSQVLVPLTPVYRWIAWTGNLRAKMFKIFYGDQGIFVRRDSFKQLGGFPNTAIGEDVLFTRRLRNHGPVVILPLSIICSTRRWAYGGFLKTFWLHMRINWAFVFGRDPNQFAPDYHDIRGK